MDDGVKSRLFIVDHLCVLPYGHNLNALVVFKRALQERFDEVICLAPERLSALAEQATEVEKVLYFPYSGILPSQSYRRSKTTRTNAASRTKGSSTDYYREAAWGFHTRLKSVLGIDYAKVRTSSNWKALIDKFNFTSKDVIFFPSAEYYGVVTLLELLEKTPPATRPSVVIRVIGVAEGAAYEDYQQRSKFLNAIRSATLRGVRVSVAAETQPLKRFLEQVLDQPIYFLTYPLSLSLKDPAWGRPLVISSPGQGRIDKGFFRLFPIIKALSAASAPGDFRFEIQDMRKSDPHFRARYSEMLARADNVTLFPERLSQEEIDAMYLSADILILPYDADTYALRGSAVYQEGISAGCMFICSAGLGLSDLVVRYDNGLNAVSDTDFVEKILSLARLDRNQVRERTDRARSRYEIDYRNGIDETFGAVQK